MIYQCPCADVILCYILVQWVRGQNRDYCSPVDNTDDDP